jgi:hypothetical protein
MCIISVIYFIHSFRFKYKIIPCLLIATMNLIFTMNVIQQDKNKIAKNFNILQ